MYYDLEVLCIVLLMQFICFLFFFSSRRRHTRFDCDWSSDVCSSDLCGRAHWDDAQGGFFDVARDRSGAAYLATPAKPVQDSPTPSANGVAALVLARLWAVTDDHEWRRLLDRQLATFGGAASQLALYGATLVRAIDWALNPVTRVEVSGARGPGPACEMHLRALQAYRPRKVVVRKAAQQPAATVCVGTTCSLPVTTLEALGDLLR